jgi:methylated-DNA-[protein]-cysteine S-methyltransferase
MKRYWDRIETPFGLFAAWVDEAARLLRFRFRSDDAERVDSEATQNPAALENVRRQVAEYSAGKRQLFEFELLPEGPEFDRQVWKALSDIPFGHTTSYGAIAKAVGQPGAARAVGAANGANPIALIVPCHRVIGSDGSLTGFGGGLPLKRKLLEHEARVCGTRYDLFG